MKDQAAHTKLKFRQPGQGTTSETARRDLRVELERAERIARNKRKGITTAEEDEEVKPEGAAVTAQEEDEQEAKRRKLIEDAAELDRDDDDDDDEEDGIDLGAEGKQASNGAEKGKGKAVENGHEDGGAGQDDDDDDDDDSSDEDDDDEDETAELLRELEKIKRERAEEKERQVRNLLIYPIPDQHTDMHVPFVHAGTRTSSLGSHFSGRGGGHWQPTAQPSSSTVRQADV